MMKNNSNRSLLILVTCLLVMAIFSGCSGGNQGAPAETTTAAPATSAAETAAQTQAAATTAAEAEFVDGPLVKYPEPITVTFIMDTSAGDAWKWEALEKLGETLEDNRFTRTYLETLNIDAKYLWIADSAQYNQKLKLAISTGDLPDVIKIPTGMRTDLMQLAEAEMIIPMDDLWKEYATDFSNQLATEDGGLAMASIAYNGQMMGVPSVTAGIHVTPHFWVRTDWLDRLGGVPPATMDEYYDYMKKVSEADLNGDGSTVYGMMVAGRHDGLGFWNQLEGLFVGFEAYPVQWIEESGKLIWGATMPQMKDGLKFVRRLYEEGLIDPEFTVKDTDKALEILASGHGATVFGWHWYTHMGLVHTIENFPEANWEVFDTPTATGRPARKRMELGLRHVYAVNKNAQHPEALIKMMNLYNEWNFGENADYEYYSSPTIDGELINDIWYFSPVEQLHAQIDTLNIEAIQPVFAGEMDPSELKGTAKTFYENCIADWTWMNMFGPGNTPGLQMVKAIHDPENLLKYNYFVGAPTPTMVDKWAQLLELTNTFAIQSITGDIEVDSGFDDFINNWSQMGGEQITKEVNEWYEANM